MELQLSTARGTTDQIEIDVNVDVAPAVSRATARWHDAVQRVVTMRKLLEFFEDLSGGDLDDKFYAAVQLSVYFKGDPDVRQKLRDIKRVLLDTSWPERFADEVGSLGDRAFDWCTPGTLGEHHRLFTVVFTLTLVSMFWYMAADWRNEQNLPWGPTTAALSATYDAHFLIDWGGLYLPSLAKGGSNWARWVTGILIHNGFVHVTSNLLLYSLVSMHLERKYGTLRVAFVSILGGLGGSLFSASFEDRCTVVVGASGLIFGLVGVWVADLVVSFHTLQYEFTRVALAVVFGVYQVISILTQKHVSHYSHLGGLITGFFPGCCFLPRSGYRRLEAFIPMAGFAMTAAIFSSLPAYVYTVRLKNLTC